MYNNIIIPKRIVAIGTSAFFGLYDEKHQGGFVGRLKKWHEEKDIDNEFYNLGISRVGVGETTGEMLARIVPEAAARQPDLLILTTGINDIRRINGKENPCITSQVTFEKNIHDMIVAAQEVAKEVTFISPYPIKDKRSSNNDYFLSEDLKTYTDIARKVCQQEHVPFVDVFAEWKKDQYDDLLGPDGVHANAKGYEKVFEQVKKFLIEHYS